eukprot:7372817-Karenia_brevis.AAC.1
MVKPTKSSTTPNQNYKVALINLDIGSCLGGKGAMALVARSDFTIDARRNQEEKEKNCEENNPLELVK